MLRTMIATRLVKLPLRGKGKKKKWEVRKGSVNFTASFLISEPEFENLLTTAAVAASRTEQLQLDLIAP